MIDDPSQYLWKIIAWAFLTIPSGAADNSLPDNWGHFYLQLPEHVSVWVEIHAQRQQLIHKNDISPVWVWSSDPKARETWRYRNRLSWLNIMRKRYGAFWGYGGVLPPAHPGTWDS